MDTSRTLLVGIILGALLLAACGEEGLPVGDPFGGDREWELTEGESDGAPLLPIPFWPVTLRVDGETVSGTAACNHYGGTISISGSTIVIDELVQTEMACMEPGVMELEAAYLTALARVDTAASGDGVLTLSGDGVELVFGPPSDPEVPTGLTGLTWALDGIQEHDAVVIPVADAWIRFEDDGTVTGHNGCNGFGGAYDPDDGFTDLYQTLIGCMGDVADQEQAFMAILGADPEIRIDGERLTIGAGDAALLFAVQEPAPDTALTGTAWTLTTIIDGDVASTPVAEAWIRFEDDGSVTGHTGCNAFGATYVPGSGFIDIERTAIGCEDAVADQERLFVAVFGADPELAIDGPTLTLTTADGQALTFHAD